MHPSWVIAASAAAAAVFIASMPARAGAAEPEPCIAATGDWAWFIGGVVTISADGTLEGRKYRGAPEVVSRGVWRCKSGTYTLTWNTGFVDRLRLSFDGKTLAGRNRQGVRVSGTRL